jgi:hypothetical protein
MTRRHVSSGGHSEDLAKKYFAMVKQAKILQLYKMYKIDFEMFGYNPEPYLSLGYENK